MDVGCTLDLGQITEGMAEIAGMGVVEVDNDG